MTDKTETEKGSNLEKDKRELIESVAENSRLELTESEKKKFEDEIFSILQSFDRLDEINIDSEVEPAFHPLDSVNNSRKDESERNLTKDQIFKNAENVERGYFKGPKASED